MTREEKNISYGVSERVQSGGWCSLVPTAQLIDRNPVTKENRQAYMREYTE